VEGEDLHAGLGVGVVGGLELQALEAEAREEGLQHAQQVGQGQRASRHHALHLVELRQVRRVQRLVAEHLHTPAFQTCLLFAPSNGPINRIIPAYILFITAVHIALQLCRDIEMEYTYIHRSRPFPIGVGRDHFLPLFTILLTFRSFHFYQIPNTRSPVSGALELALLLIPQFGQEMFINAIYMYFQLLFLIQYGR
jgi:hypothetical protein